ncbi:hypothetical protein CES86_5671 [Brucella lupini]|uniref:Uncharacterized protein n=1 Tax=Brucella lupini TaxID=255457 RepID=A0A256GZE1_9HYPH|nr:hypothetical protein CES86_5671 [Brucella lupini]
MANKSNPITVSECQRNIIQTTYNHKTITAPFDFSTRRNAKNAIF